MNAIRRCGWKERGKSHFVYALKEDGPKNGITTLGHLERAIRKGHSIPSRNGTTIHWICSGNAYIAYNAQDRVLVTFSFGRYKGDQPEEG